MDPASRLHLPALDTLRLFAHAAHRSERYGERRGRAAGGRMEFVDYRPYVPGDDPRRVDWNVVARTDRYVVKEYLRESGLPVHLLIDVSRSMTVGQPGALDTAKEIARGLAYLALIHSDIVSVSGIADTATGRVRTTGRNALAKIERTLAGFAARPQSDFQRSLRGYAARVHETGVALVLSDLLDASGFEEGLRALRVRQFEVAVVHLVIPELFDPDLPSDALVTDAESGRTREITWNADVREAYASRRDRFLDHAATWCAQHGIRYARVRTDLDLHDVFLKEFRSARIVV